MKHSGWVAQISSNIQPYFLVMGGREGRGRRRICSSSLEIACDHCLSVYPSPVLRPPSQAPDDRLTVTSRMIRPVPHTSAPSMKCRPVNLVLENGQIASMRGQS